MRGKFIGACAITVAALFTHAASAANYMVCDSCTQAQMRDRSLQAGLGRYIVGDVINQQVVAYVVKNQPRSSGDPVKIAGLDALTPQEINAFNSLVAFYNDAPVGYQKVFNLIIDPSAGAAGTIGKPLTAAERLGPMSEPTPGGGHITYPNGNLSAFDVIDQSPTQNKFLEWVGTVPQFGIEKAMNDLASVVSVIHVLDVSHLPGLSYTVTFTDGSQIGVYVDTIQQPAQISVNTATAIDSHGNIIPVNQPAIAGSGTKVYNYHGSGSAGDLGRMSDRLQRFEVNPPRTVEWACTRVGGGDIHCVPVS